MSRCWATGRLSRPRKAGRAREARAGVGVRCRRPTWPQTAAVAARRRFRSVHHRARPVPGTTAMERSRPRSRPPARIRRPSRRHERQAPPRSATLVAPAPVRPVRDPDDVTDGADAPPTRERIAYVLPPLPLLDDVAVPIMTGGDEAAHAGTRRSSSRSSPGSESRSKIIGRNAGPGRDPVRGSAGTGHQGQPDRGSFGRPRDGAGRPDAPDRGADPGQERGRHRDPEQGLQHRRPPRGSSRRSISRRQARR